MFIVFNKNLKIFIDVSLSVVVTIKLSQNIILKRHMLTKTKDKLHKCDISKNKFSHK